ncbi:MAG: hypothetical protein JWM82_2021 [Myxococcales bacterium]|nr:hypothetical protein [Myxococcales bacterium]
MGTIRGEQLFEIQLAGLETTEPGTAFILGIEWGIAWEKAKTTGAGGICVHAENAARIGEMLRRQGRRFTSIRHPRGFVELVIEGLD